MLTMTMLHREQPLTRETANPNAATAAASAFMRREPQPATLSSAAAAAALRARPITPTNVAEAPSRRTARRSASVSSSNGRGRDALHRTPSNGSMSERTFRSPSPGGQSPRRGVPSQQNVPPVPSLPRGQGAHRASASLSTQPFRTASQKMKDGQQSSWFGAATAGEASNMRKSDAIMHSAYQTHKPRARSVSPSINFSYPRAKMDVDSPSSSSHPSQEQTMVYDPNSRRMVPVVPKVDLMNRQQSVREAADKPVKKRKPEASRSGTHLAKGNVSRPQVAPLDVPKSTPAQAPREVTPEPRPEPRAATRPASTASTQLAEEAWEDEGVDEAGKQDIAPPRIHNDALVEHKTSDAQPAKLDMRVADGATVVPPTGPLALGQSTADELASDEESDDEPQRPETVNAIDAVPVRSSQSPPQEVKPKVMETDRVTVVAQPTTTTTMPNQVGSVRKARVHSESPVRSAHFATTTDSLMIKHEPPPRSLSPRKSALKQSGSIRGVSPSDDGSDASGLASKDDAAAARKKSVRVSFNDDQNIVVGESAQAPETDTPIIPSPQAKKPWHNLIGRGKKENALNEEETMSPRPALPLFGSIREKKAREPDNERPLVRPTERAWSPQSSNLHQHTSSVDTASSADSAIGTVLAQESSRNEANISKFREPLPPVVTSVEGGGYMSSSSESSDDDFDTEEPTSTQASEPLSEPASPVSSKIPDTIPEEPAKTKEAEIRDKANGTVLNKEASTVPSIAIIHPSPHARESPTSPDNEYFDVPGDTPDDQDGPSASTSEKPKPVERASSPTHHVIAPTTGIPVENIKEEDNEGSGSGSEESIYSDAYEDLSDLEGEGFMSLDAVLSGHTNPKTSELIVEKTMEARRTSGEMSREVIEAGSGSLPTPNDWENAKIYWRSLSADKRRQLEREAMEEAGEEADVETSPKTKKKHKKRKSTEAPVVTIAADTSADERMIEGPTDSSDRIYQSQPRGTRTDDASHLYNAAQSTVAPVPKMRKSLRGEPPSEQLPVTQSTGNMRKTLRSNGTAGNNEAAARPISYHTSTPAEISKNSQQRLPQSASERPKSSSGLGLGMRPAPKRRGSESSESSFQRARPSGGEGMGFRRTMRTAPTPATSVPDSPMGSAKGSSRFSLRSLSPTGSTFRRPNVGSPPPTMGTGMGSRGMRTSLREGPGQQQTSSKKRNPFGRSDKKPKKGKNGSRFDDSSDEESTGPRMFSSRFADSSDEEETPRPRSMGGGLASKSLRTGNGKPARGANSAALGIGSVRPSDSPDLPDSEDDIVQPKRHTIIASGNGSADAMLAGELRRTRSGRGIADPLPGQVNTQTMAGDHPRQRRGSFMGAILRRKPDAGGKITRDHKESAARRDTRLERSQEELAIIRSNSGNQGSSSSSRLQKKGPSWPLPEPDEVAPQRPATAGGPAANGKSGYPQRRSTSLQGTIIVPPSSASDGTPAADLGTGKKKKFGALRKMLRLGD